MLKIILIFFIFITVGEQGIFSPNLPWFCVIQPFPNSAYNKLQECEEKRSPNSDWEGWYNCFSKTLEMGKGIKQFKKAMCDLEKFKKITYCTNTRFPVVSLSQEQYKQLEICLTGKSRRNQNPIYNQKRQQQRRQQDDDEDDE